MAKPDSSPCAACCRVVDAEVSFHKCELIRPLVLSTGSICDVVEARAAVRVELPGCEQATGRGAILLSDQWAWPDIHVSHDLRVHILIGLTERMAADLHHIAEAEFLHPLEAGLRLHAWAHATSIADADVPALARAMCASPFDAAIHDAVGIALQRSAFDLYHEDAPVPSAEVYFPADGVVPAIRRLVRPPRKELPAWLVVNMNDELPEAIADACARHEYRCFKLKITGHDSAADAARTAEVFRAARQLGIARPVLTIDSNEANPDAASVLDYLERLKSTDCDAYQALAYLEQPTSRDIVRAPFDWRPVAAHKPVLLDEGLTDLAILDVAQQQGWSGFALKTCKGHSMLLTAAAWARQRGLLLSLQDLTNPGIALIHGALVGSRLPTINGAELNSPQFTPAANADFLPRLGDLFEPKRGRHRLPSHVPTGLGSSL